jgi:prepilin-type processing-associated H-X9-DG protein
MMNVPLHPGVPGPDRQEPRAQPPRWSRSALVSFGLGLLSLLLLIVTGLPALLLGYRSLYDINASEGRLRGRVLAVGGMILGGLGTLGAVAYVLFLLFARLQQTSERADCTNNLRQIGLALELYQEKNKGTYPSATVPNAALPPGQRLSWLAAILPFMERKGTAKADWQTLVQSIDWKAGWETDANKPLQTRKVPAFVCRGCPFEEYGPTPGLTTYVGLAGLGADAPLLERNDPRAGFFGYDRVVTKKSVENQSSYTLIVTETTRDNGPWSAGGRPTVRGVDPEERPFFGVGAPFGGCHPGGLNTLWLDGSVRFQKDTQPPELFAKLTRLQRP